MSLLMSVVLWWFSFDGFVLFRFLMLVVGLFLVFGLGYLMLLILKRKGYRINSKYIDLDVSKEELIEQLEK